MCQPPCTWMSAVRARAGVVFPKMGLREFGTCGGVSPPAGFQPTSSEQREAMSRSPLEPFVLEDGFAILDGGLATELETQVNAEVQDAACAFIRTSIICTAFRTH